MHSHKIENLPNTVLLPERATAGDPATGTDSAADACIVPGAIVGPYRVDGVLGAGGMGVVYKAYDTLLDRTVALKVLPPRLLHNQEFLHRFRTEAQAQARLHSPNVVTLYSLLEVPAGLVLVMEYVEGESLDKRIRRGPLPVDEAVRIFDYALQGVESAHRMGIVHRDLKPGNIFITTQNEIKIMDFGVARILDNRELTHAGTMLGTLLYIPPEQINGKEADFRSDVYTLGVSLFEAVTGRLPFERKSDYSLMHAHILEKPPNPRTLRREVPKRLENVILKAIEKDPDKRYPGAPQFRAALRKAANPGALEPMPAETAVAPLSASLLPPALRRSLFDRRGKKPGPLGGLGLDLLLIACVGVLIFALGLFPGTGRQATVDATATDSVPGTTDTAAHSEALPAAQTAAAPSHPARRTEKNPASTNREPSPAADRAHRPPAKKYDTLRKAWGGG